MKKIFYLSLSMLFFSLLQLNAQDVADPNDANTWAVTPAFYPNNMVVTAVINIEGEESMDPNDKVAAFFGDTDNIRGVASPMFVPGLNRYIASLFIYSETGNTDPITFRVYDASSGLVLPCITTETFATDKLVGSIANPDTIFTIRIEIDFHKDDVLCSADNFGFAKANITGGTQPYSLLWSTGSTEDSIYNLSAGRYYLSVTDANNFTKVDSVDILNLNRPIQAPLLVAGPGNTVCQGTDVYVFAFTSEMESPAYQWYDIFNNQIHVGQALTLPDIAAPIQVSAETNVRNCLSPRTNISIAVNPAPNANFAVNTNTANTQDVIIFTPTVISPTATYSWQFGDGGTSSLPNPQHIYTAPGNYLVWLTVSTPDGCTAQSFQFISITEKDIDILIDITKPHCPTDNSGELYAQAINGTAPYTYQWSTGATGTTLSNLLAGTYGLTVTDADGNVQNTTILLQAEQALQAPTLIVNGENIICKGDDVWITALSSADGAEYYWYRDAAGTDLKYIGNPLILFGLEESKTFWVETRKDGCRSATKTQVTISVATPNASFDSSVEVAYPGQSISFFPLAPQFGQSYLWDFGDNTPNSTAPSINHTYDNPGVYLVHFTVTHTLTGCSETQSIVINILELPQAGGPDMVAIASSTDANCTGDASGSASVQVLNGTGPYSYQWSNGSSSSSITGLMPGLYSVTVQDSQGKTATATVTIGAQYSTLDPPSVIANGGQDICFGDDIWLAASSDYPNAEYHWYDAANGGELLFVGNPLMLNNYAGPADIYVEARIGGCASAARAEVNIPAQELLTAFTASEAVIPEGGIITFTPDSVVAGYAYRWDFGDGNFDSGTSVSNQYFFQGTYRVTLTVVSPDSCRASQDMFINVYSQSGGLALAFNLQHVACPDDATGSASSLVFGGTPPYTYEWDNGATTASLVGLTAGAYKLTVTDALGNTVEGEATILSTQPELLAPDVFANAGLPVCQGGTAWAAASSNITGATFYWYDAPVGGQLKFVGNPLLLDNLQSAQAFFVEASYQGCVSAARTELIIPIESPDASFTVSATIVEVNMPVDFTATGPGTQSYSWDFGDSEVATGANATHAFAEPGIYEVVLEAGLFAGCTARSRRFIRVVPDMLGLNASFLVEPAQCINGAGSVQAQASGGTPPYGYIWSNGFTGPVQTGLAVGSYTVTVMDALGVTAVETIEIESNTPAISMPTVTVNGGQPFCLGEPGMAVAITNVSGADYRWWDSANGGNLLFSGASFPVGSIQEPTTLYVEAYYQGCLSQGRQMVQLTPQGPDASFAVQGSNIQIGSPVGFMPSTQDNSYTYQWNFGDGSQSAEMSPQHAFQGQGDFPVTLTLTDANGCSATEEQLISVGVGQSLALLFNTTDVQCYTDNAGSILVDVFNGNPPYNYEWSNGATGAYLQGLLPGSYTVTVTDGDGATITGQAEVHSAVGELLPPQAVVSGGNSVCSDEYLVIYAYDNQGNATNFFWYSAPQGGSLLGSGNIYSEFGVDQNTTYYVEAASGVCRSGQRTEVQVYADDPNQGFTASANTIVEGGIVTFTPLLADPDYTYQWFFGDGATSTQMTPTHTYAAEGNYTVRLTVTSTGGCTDFVQYNEYVRVISSTTLAILFDISHVDCQGQSDGAITANVLNGTPPLSYQWSNGATGASITGLPVGSYALTVTDGAGLSAVQSGSIATLYSTPSEPFISTNASLPLCTGEQAVLLASSGQLVDNYFWYDSNDILLGTGPSLVVDPQQGPLTVFVEGQRGSCFSPRAEREFEVQTLNAGFSVAGSLQPFAGDAVQFSAEETGYAGYYWQFGDGNTASNANPQHAYGNAGQYTVSLTVTSAEGCNATESIPAYLSVQPEVAFSISSSVTNTLCDADQSGRIELSIAGGTPPYTINWDNGASGAVLQDLAPGSYAYTVTDSEGHGSQGSAEVANLNVAIPMPTISINGNAPACIGQPAYLVGATPGYPQASVYWYESLSEPDEFYSGNLLVLPQLMQSTIVYGESVVNGCRSARVPVTVQIQAPNATFSISPGSVLEEGDLVQFVPANANPGYTYYWQFGDNGWSTSMEPYYFYNLVGTFDVSLTVTDDDGCQNTLMKEDFVTVSAYQGLAPEELEERSQNEQADSRIAGIAFPNPFGDVVTLVLKLENKGWYQLRLSDMLGRPVWVSSAYFRDNVEQLQMNFTETGLQDGLYLLSVEGENGEKAIFKLLKN